MALPKYQVLLARWNKRIHPPHHEKPYSDMAVRICVYEHVYYNYNYRLESD